MRQSLAELRVLVTSDKRKATVLVVLMGVLMLAMGRAFLGAEPASARATSASASRRERMFSDERSAALVETPGTLVLVPRGGAVSKNIFELDPSVFPPPAQTDSTPSLPPNSRTELADDPAEIPEVGRAQEAQHYLERLRLRSTVQGAKPLALIEVISGRHGEKNWVRPGDRIGPFTLVRVETRRVVLEVDGVEHELLSDPSDE